MFCQFFVNFLQARFESYPGIHLAFNCESANPVFGSCRAENVDGRNTGSVYELDKLQKMLHYTALLLNKE